MSLAKQIAEVFSFELGIPDDEVTPELKYGEAPEWTSNSHMVLIMALEDRFGLTFESEEIVEMTDLASIERLLRQKGAADEANG